MTHYITRSAFIRRTGCAGSRMLFTKDNLPSESKKAFPAEFSPGNAEAFQKIPNTFPPRFYQKRGGNPVQYD
jgi:hypothetical protein